MNVVTKLGDCEKLWKEFTPNEDLWDEWDIAVSFFSKDAYSLHFMHKDGVRPGLLPLWLDKSNNIHYFFGGTFPENRKLWLATEDFAEFLDKAPAPLKLFDINGVDFKKACAFADLCGMVASEDKRYFLKTADFAGDFSKYLATFSKKHKKNFQYDLKKLQDNGFITHWSKESHLDDIKIFNLRRFGAESDYADEQFVKEMESFVKVLQEKNLLHTCVIKKDDKIEAVEIAAFYKGNYHILNGGHSGLVPNLGKLLIAEHIKHALSIDAAEVDMLVGDTGWKALWNLSAETVVTLEKKS